VLAKAGAKHIVLVSRSGRVAYAGQGLEDDLAWLQSPESGVEVRIICCDVSDERSVVSMLEEARSIAGGIEGIVHSAGVIRDGLIRGGRAAAGSMEVWNSKALSAWWLHKHSQQDNLRYFIAYSSMTAAIGNPGQSAYGAANRFLDKLMSDRQRCGMSGISIQWPGVADVGMAAANKQMEQNGSNATALSIVAMDVQKVLEDVLSNQSQSGSELLVIPSAVMSLLNGSRVSRQFQNVVKKTLHSSSTRVGMSSKKISSRTVVSSFTPVAINDIIKQAVATLVDKSVDVDTVELDFQLMEVGIDSMGASELATILSKSFGVKLLPTLLFNYPTMKDISVHVHEMLGLTGAEDDDITADFKTPTTVSSFEDVAIVGVSCRLPGDVNSLDEMWEMLCSKDVKSGEVSLNRWDTDAIIADMCRKGEKQVDVLNRIRYGGFLSDSVLESFDPSLYGLSNAEAKYMDPGQRLLLDACYEAFMDAGIEKSSLKGRKVGVFIAAMGSLESDGENGVVSSQLLDKQSLSVYSATGKGLSVSSGRISYIFGLHGPSLTVDTACSSSLVALHSARRSLQLGECDMAVVAGVQIMKSVGGITCATAGMTSSDGRCHTFDSEANGYCRGEGCGAIVLKRVSEAVECSDNIYAVVRGSAVMQDGRSASMTAPSGSAQEMLLRSTLRDAKVEAKHVHFIEAHGTGTPLGDPIEAGSVAAVYGKDRSADVPLFMSSTKANIGHLEAAAGMVGLFAAILVLRHGVAPPNAQLNTLNPKIGQVLSDTPIVLPTSAMTIPRRRGERLLAGVNSFGYSGTIAHVILEEPPQTVQHKNLLHNDVVWQFSGQGTLSVGVSRHLYDTNQAFSSAMSKSDVICKALLGVAPTEVLYPDISNLYTDDAARALLLNTRFAQPFLVAYECSLAEAYKDQGGLPKYVIGHSLGEYSAAVIAEVLSLEECLRLVVARGRLVDECASSRGCMAAIRLPRDEIDDRIRSLGLSSEVFVAAVNGERNCVTSGTVDGMMSFFSTLDSAGISYRRLEVQNAFHSPLLNGMVDAYSTVLSTYSMGAPIVKIISTVLGREVTANEITDKQYWINHLVQAVLYADAVKHCANIGCRIFVEVGPDQTLSKLGSRVCSSNEVKWLHAEYAITNAFATSTVMALKKPRQKSFKAFYRGNWPHRMLQKSLVVEYSQLTVHTCRLHKGILNDWLLDHCLGEQVVVPGAAILEMCCAAALQSFIVKTDIPKFSSLPTVYMEGFRILQPVVANDVTSSSSEQPTAIDCVLEDDGSILVCQEHGDDQSRETHAEGTVTVLAMDGSSDPDWSSLTEVARSAISDCTVSADVSSLYDNFLAGGIKYGPVFRLITEAFYSSTSDSVCVCRVSLKDASLQQSYFIPPNIIDNMLQSSAVILSRLRPPNSKAVAQVPFSFDQTWIRSDLAKSLWDAQSCTILVQISSSNEEMSVFDCSLLNNDLDIVMHIKGVYVRAIAIGLLESDSKTSIELLDSKWTTLPICNSETRRISKILLVGSGSSTSSLTTTLASQFDSKVSCITFQSFLLECEITSSMFDLTVLFNDDLGIPEVGAVSDWIQLVEKVSKLTTRFLVVSIQSLASTSLSWIDTVTSSISGVLMSAQLEYSHVEFVSMVVNSESQYEDFEVVARNVTNEINVWDGEMEVLYSNQQRLVRRFALCRRNPSSQNQQTVGGTYVITGGLGGLGLLTAKVLAKAGAKHIVLVSRSGRVAYAGQGLEDDLAWLQSPESGVEVRIICCDVSDERSVVSMLEEARSIAGGIEGIVHSAGVIRDGLIRGGRAAAGSMEVWNSKALSAWWLHKHSQQDNLRYFIAYSSMTAAIGNPGQSAYGAANRFLDKLMSDRQRCGMSGISIQWPGVADVGMAAANKQMEQNGKNSLGLAIMASDAEQILSSYFSNGNNFESILLIMPSLLLKASQGVKIGRCFEFVVEADVVSRSQKNVVKSKPSTLTNTASLKFSLSQVTSAVKSLVESLSNYTEDDIETVTLVDAGIDSLAATELAGELSKLFHIELAPIFLLEYPTVRDISDHIYSQLESSETVVVDDHIEDSLVPSSEVSERDCIDSVPQSRPSSLFISREVRSPICRVFIIPGFTMPPSYYLPFAKVLNNQRLSTHIVTFPGRSERQDEKPFEHIGELSTILIEAIRELNWINDIPMIFIGHSMGTYVAYDCLKLLETNSQLRNTSQLISIFGITKEHISQFYKKSDNDKDFSQVDKMAVANEVFGDKGKQIMANEFGSNAFAIDEKYILQWINGMYQREANNSLNLKIKCDLTWIVADQDPGTKVEFDGWKDLTAANYQRIVFKGDHFMLFESMKNCEAIASECARNILRNL